MCEQVLESRKAKLGQDDPLTLAAMLPLAESYCFAGQLDVGARLLEQMLDRCITIYGPTHSETLGTMHQLAMVHEAAGRLADSIAMHERVLALHNSSSDPRDYPSWITLTLAQVCHQAGKYEQAERLLREVLQHCQNQKDSLALRNTRANTLGLLALSLLSQQRYEEAEPLAREAVAIDQIEKHRHFHHVSVLGAVLLGQRKYSRGRVPPSARLRRHEAERGHAPQCEETADSDR